jgi:hypothetical protein
MFLPEAANQFTLVLAPLVSVALVIIAALIANAIVFPSIVGNALVKVLVQAAMFFVLKMAYLMYRVWPAYIKQTTTPSIGDFIVRRARDVGVSVAASAVFFFIVALVANAIAHRKRGPNIWATVIVFALAYAAVIYGSQTTSFISTVLDALF